MNLLILGGSGFLSGTLARVAASQGHGVTVVTRGRRPTPADAKAVAVDRHKPKAFAKAIAKAARREPDERWDLVVDCICFNADDARQDLAVFADRARRLVVISTDFVFEPSKRQTPQLEEGVYREDESYGGHKRRAERVLEEEAGVLPWFVLRPGHIYGPGSELGCLPLHSRDPELIDRMRRGEPLRLVDGGRFRQQPVFAPDLAATILGCHDRGAMGNGVFNVAGPDTVESRLYYRYIADALDLECHVEAEPVDAYLQAHPEQEQFCVDRVLALGKLRGSKLPAPSTSLSEGLRVHVDDRVARLGGQRG